MMKPVSDAVEALTNLDRLLTSWTVRWKRAHPAALNHVPGPPASFVNRLDEIKRACQIISEGERVVAIEGDPGVGKTAVARKLVDTLRASQAPKVSRRRSAYWIDCEYGCPSIANICRELSTQSGDPSLSAAPAHAKLTALRTFLADGNSVLLLDDLTIAGTKSSRQLLVLLRDLPNGALVIITFVGKEDLMDALELPGTRVKVTNLALKDARAFIQTELTRAGLQTIVLDEHGIDEIVARVGANPKAIQRVVAQLDHRAGSWETVLLNMERDDDTRYESVWKRLSTPEARVLAACTHLRGHATREEVARACSLADRIVTLALDALERAGLVEASRVHGQSATYRCPRPVERWFGANRQSELDMVRCVVVRQLMQRLSENPRRAMDAVGVVRRVLDDLSEVGRDAEFLELFNLTFDAFFTRRLLDDRIEYGRRATESAARCGDDCAASLAYSVLSSTHALRGEFREADRAVGDGEAAAERARQTAQSAVQRARAAGEAARQQGCKGLSLYRQGRAEECLRAIGGAEDRARQAVASAGALPASDPAREILINVLCLRSAALWYLGQLTQSEETARMCLSACTEARWPRAEAYPLRDLAEIAIHRGDYRQAREWIGSARARAEDWSDVRQLIRLDLTEARLLLMTGRLRRARSLAHRAAEEAESLALGPEAKESAALRRAAGRPLSVVRYKRHRPLRLTDAPVGGD